jgi:GT2 family glycosyltransferase
MSKKHTKTQQALVDVAILTAGQIPPALFETCLRTACEEAAPLGGKVHVFRNSVPEESRIAYDEILKKYPVSVTVSREDKGFPYGANRAIRSGMAPLVLFLSDDVILDTGTLDKLVRRMDDPSIGLCGLKLIFPVDSPDPGRPAGKVQHVGHGIDIRGEIVHPLIGWNPANPRCNVSRDVVSVTGAAFMVRRKIFNLAGGFFEGFGLGYFEDVDLCLEIRRLGHRIFIDTEATAIHHVGATFAKKNVPAPFEQNKAILRARKGGLFAHDSWLFWVLVGLC